MSLGKISGKVGDFALEFSSAPRGSTGEVEVSLIDADGKSQKMPVRWRRDSYGIWIETPAGVFGYDLTPQRESDGDGAEVLRTVDAFARTKDGREYAGLRFVRSGEESTLGGATTGKKRAAKIRAQMPGKIVKILVTAGAAIKKGQPLLTMEAMKMENEIRASQDGVVAKILVQEAQAVESGAELLVLE